MVGSFGSVSVATQTIPKNTTNKKETEKMVRLDLKSMLDTKKNYAIMYSIYDRTQFVELVSTKKDWTIDENFWEDVNIWQEKMEIVLNLKDCTILHPHDTELVYMLEKGLDDVRHRTMNVIKMQYKSRRGTCNKVTIIPLDKGGRRL